MPMMAFKVASLNLCLGIPNKKNNVKKMITDENIDVLCMHAGDKCGKKSSP